MKDPKTNPYPCKTIVNFTIFVVNLTFFCLIFLIFFNHYAVCYLRYLAGLQNGKRVRNRVPLFIEITLHNGIMRYNQRSL